MPAAPGRRKQRLRQGLLQMPMAGLDGTVLMCNTEVVAGGGHTVMHTKRLVAPGLIFCGITIQIAERR
jgi:hypothetical protein